jgi:hypothetical protein
MANTYEAIATVTVGSGGAANIEFTSIPATYTDLLIKLSVRTSASANAQNTALNLSINGVTTNRSWRRIDGYSGTTVDSTNGTSALVGTLGGSLVTANTFASNELYIPNYAGSNNKSFSAETASEDNSATSNDLELLAGLWSNSAAITSLTFSAGSGNFVQYSTATLYGIKNS